MLKVVAGGTEAEVDVKYVGVLSRMKWNHILMFIHSLELWIHQNLAGMARPEENTNWCYIALFL